MNQMIKIWTEKAEALETRAKTEFHVNGCFNAALAEKVAALKSAASRVRQYEIEARR